MLSTVLGTQYMLNKYELLLFKYHSDHGRNTSSDSLVHLENAQMPQLAVEALTIQPCLPSASLCHENPTSKPLGPSRRGAPSSPLGFAVCPLPFIRPHRSPTSQACSGSLQEAFVMAATQPVLPSSELPHTDSRRWGRSESSHLNPHLSPNKFLPCLDSEPGVGRARSAEMTGTSHSHLCSWR